MKTKTTTRLTPACCLWQQGFRDALQRLSMTLMLVMLTAMTAWAQGVDYIDANGVVKNTATDDIVGNDNPTVLTGGGETTLSAGWYVVNSDITYTGDALTGLVFLDGDVTIILCNGCTMNIGKSENEPVTGSGIRGLECSLTIYGQTLDEGTAGQLRIYTFYTSFGTAGILSSTYTQHSGNVTINSFGNNAIYASNITINGGKLDATASTLWQWASSSDVIALAGSNITMNGGIVNATGIQEYSGNSADGIACTTFTLGWRNASDRFTASSFAMGTVSIADGQVFTDGSGNNFYGTIADVSTIAGKTLIPVTNAVPYVDAEGATAYCTSYTEINTSNMPTTLSAGWYVVTENITYTGTVTLDGDVNIILADVCTMNVGTSESRISGSCIESVTEGLFDAKYSLTIYGQSGQSGALNAYNNDDLSIAVYVKSYAQYGGNVTIDNSKYSALCLHEGDLTLTRGSLTANSKNDAISADEHTVNVSGGTLTANGSLKGIYGNVIMSGGTVTATGAWYGIDGGVTMTGGTFTANGGGVGINNNVTFSGGNLTAIGTDDGIDGTVSLRWTSPDDRFTASSFGGPGTETVTIADGQAFTDGTDIYTGTLSSDEKAAIAGKTLQPLTAVSLADAADNATAIGKLDGVEDIDITLSGRTLWKDGAWNTLCLPFDVTIAGSILDGADVRALDNANLTGNVLTLNFTDKGTVTEIEAGTPYIIKWASGANISDPEFTGVTVKSGMSDFESTDDKVTFKGTYDYMSWTEETPSILFVGDDNNLHWPEEGASLGACRAYFELSDVEPEPGTGGAPELRIVLNFGEEEKTGISSLTPAPSPKGEGSDYYTLDGRKLNAKPMKKGLYIHNGRKVVIK